MDTMYLLLRANRTIDPRKAEYYVSLLFSEKAGP